jgi:hypothetical protein
MRINSTTDINLAVALLTMGVPPTEKDHFQKVKSVRGETCVFHFQDKTQCGTYKTRDLMKYWDDDDFEINNPDHPFTLLKVYDRNKNGLLDWIKKQAATLIVEMDGRYLIIPEDYPIEKQMNLIDQL